VTRSRPLRGAIVGAGLMGRWHAHAVARLGHSVAAVVDPDRSRAAALASQYDNCVPATALATAPAVDVVHVCTPLGSHVDVAREAIARGAHVIVEKPFAETATETALVLRLAQSSGRLVAPVHQFLFQRGIGESQRALPAIGVPLHVDFVACTAGASHLAVAEQDRIAMEIVPHPLSLIARLVSPKLADVEWQVRHTAPGELRVQGALLETTIAILISTRGRPTTNMLRLIGAGGTVHVDLYHGFATLTRGRATRAGKVLQPFLGSGATFLRAAMNLARRGAAGEPAYPGLRDLIARFYAAVQSGGPAPISPDECLAVAQAMERIGAALSR